MRHLLLIAIITLSSALQLVAQSVQRGLTLEYQGRQAKTSLSNVNVRAYGSTAMSNAQGQFAIRFNDLRVGSRIVGVKVSKEGYVLFNKDAIDQWNVSNEAFQIVMCREDQFEAWVDQYYNLGLASYRQQYDRECEAARQQRASNTLTEQQTNALLREAYDRYQNSMQMLDEHAQAMARIDESQLDSVRLQALNMVRQGLFDQAIALIDEQDYESELERLAQKSRMGEEQIALADENLAITQANIQKLIEALKFEIEARRLRGGKANFDLCKQYWIQIAQTDTTNVDNTFACAYFLHNQNDILLAERYYTMTLNAYRQKAVANPAAYDILIANILNNLASVHHAINRYQEAEQEFVEAINLYYKVAERHPALGNSGVAATLNNLAYLHLQVNNKTLSAQELNEALVTYRQLSAADPDTYRPYIAHLLSSLAIVHRELYEYDQAEAENSEALAIYRQLAGKHPNQFDAQIARVLNNLGNLHSETHDSVRAEQEFAEALTIYQQLATNNPDANNGSFANMLCNVGLFHNRNSQHNQAAQEYGQAADLYRRLAFSNPATFNPALAEALIGLANQHFSLHQYTMAEQEWTEAITVSHQLSAADPAYSQFASKLKFLAIMYLAEDMPTQSERLFDEILAIHRRLADVYPAFRPELASELLNRADLFTRQNNDIQAETYLREALTLYGQLADQEPDEYRSRAETAASRLVDHYAQTQCSPQELTSAYQSLGSASVYVASYLFGVARWNSDYPQAIQQCTYAWHIYRPLAQDNPSIYCSDMVAVLKYIITLYRSLEKYPEAEPAYQELIEANKQVGAAPSVIAQDLFDLAYIHQTHLHNDAQAEQEYAQALVLFRQLAADNPQDYHYAVSSTLNNLGVIHESQQNYTQAEQEYLEASTILRQHADSDPDHYEAEIAQYEQNLANVRGHK